MLRELNRRRSVYSQGINLELSHPQIFPYLFCIEHKGCGQSNALKGRLSLDSGKTLTGDPDPFATALLAGVILC